MNRARVPRLLLLGAFAAVPLFVAAGPAVGQECADNVDNVLRDTPAGEPVCGPEESPTPSPSPSPSSTSSSKPKPKQSTNPNTTPSSNPFPTYSPPVFPTPDSDQFLALPPPNAPGAGLPGFPGFPPGFTLPQPPSPPTGAAEQLGQTPPSFFGTGPGLAGVRPSSNGGGRFAPRAALLVLLAAGGAFWLRRARVRSWMIGI